MPSEAPSGIETETGTPEIDERQEGGNGDGEGRFSVLEVFGLKLEVSNPRIAELLTMDAKDALNTDLRELSGPGVPGSPRDQLSEALPEAVISPSSPHDEVQARMRREFRARTDRVGESLGFDVRADGTWVSPSGVAILTRAIERPLSLAAASHFVSEIASRREAVAGPDSTALFVVDTQQSADVFKVAIRHGRLYDVMRTVSIDNLERIAELLRVGEIDHSKAVVLLVPLANIDVGEVLAVIGAVADEEPGE